MARSLRRPPNETELLLEPAAEVREALRGEVYSLSRHAVPWSTLQHVGNLSDLVALRALYGRIHAGERFLLVHAHGSLPRRLLALGTACALAHEQNRSLALVWPADDRLSAPFDALFDVDDAFAPAAIGAAVDGTAAPAARGSLPVLRSFFAALAPPELFARWEHHGSPAQRRANPVREVDYDDQLYVKTTGPIETQPPVRPEAVRACLAALRPAGEARRLIESIGGGSVRAAAQVGRAHKCDALAFAKRLGAGGGGDGRVYVSMDAWEAEGTLLEASAVPSSSGLRPSSRLRRRIAQRAAPARRRGARGRQRARPSQSPTGSSSRARRRRTSPTAPPLVSWWRARCPRARA